MINRSEKIRSRLLFPVCSCEGLNPDRLKPPLNRSALPRSLPDPIPVGGYGGAEPPVPIPNTAVKRPRAGHTPGVTPREPRSPPALFRSYPEDPEDRDYPEDRGDPEDPEDRDYWDY